MARRKLLALTIVLVGCGEFLGFGDDDDVPSTPNGPASGDDASAPDAAPRCNPNGEWQTPVRVDSVSTDDANEANVTLSADELTIFVDRAPPLAADSTILSATRPNRDAPFGPLTAVAEIDTPEFEGHPFLTSDGRSLYFARSTASRAILRADRSSVTESFGAASPVVAHEDTDGHPHVFGTDLWYTSEKANGFNGIRVRPLSATNPTDPAPSAFVALPLPDGGGDRFHDLQPVIDPTGLTLYFASSRSDPQFDIYIARRSSTDAPFAGPEPASALSSPASDFASWVSPDGCRIYLTSTRAGATLDVFMAERAR